MQELFAVAAPGLEPLVAAELRALGHAGDVDVGGVRFQAPYDALVPLNRQLSVSSRILMRFGAFRCVHLAELTKLTRRLAWSEVLIPGARVRIKATCRKSKIYHSGAAAQRVREGINHVVPLGEPVQGEAEQSDTCAQTDVQEIVVRIERDMCELSINSSGEHLHRRGYKLETAKAPLRETLAAGLLSLCEWTPTQALIDPMCGSGTFVIEAARQMAGLEPGAGRAFACQAWPVVRRGVRKAKAAATRAAKGAAADTLPKSTEQLKSTAGAPAVIQAYDRDAGAIASTLRNAERAGVAPHLTAHCQALKALRRPDCEPGLVIVNPPWGERVGDRRALRNLYASIGHLMRTEMQGWRLGLVTAQPQLAQATGLKFTSISEPLLHGGLRIRLYRFDPVLDPQAV